MRKIKVKITNKGNRTRERLGSRVRPNEEKIIEITNNRELLTLKAVKDFEVKLIKEENTENEENNTENEVETEKQEEHTENVNKDTGNLSEDDYNELTIEEVLKHVESGLLDIDEAVAYETVGKNRKTLLDKLDNLRVGG